MVVTLHFVTLEDAEREGQMFLLDRLERADGLLEDDTGFLVAVGRMLFVG